jgi:hypothetical protein
MFGTEKLKDNIKFERQNNYDSNVVFIIKINNNLKQNIHLLRL